MYIYVLVSRPIYSERLLLFRLSNVKHQRKNREHKWMQSIAHCEWALKVHNITPPFFYLGYITFPLSINYYYVYWSMINRICRRGNDRKTENGCHLKKSRSYWPTYARYKGSFGCTCVVKETVTSQDSRREKGGQTSAVMIKPVARWLSIDNGTNNDAGWRCWMTTHDGQHMITKVLSHKCQMSQKVWP